MGNQLKSEWRACLDLVVSGIAKDCECQEKIKEGNITEYFECKSCIAKKYFNLLKPIMEGIKKDIANSVSDCEPCPFNFRSMMCGYIGDEDWCDKTLIRCRQLENEKNFPEMNKLFRSKKFIILDVEKKLIGNIHKVSISLNKNNYIYFITAKDYEEFIHAYEINHYGFALKILNERKISPVSGGNCDHPFELQCIDGRDSRFIVRHGYGYRRRVGK